MKDPEIPGAILIKSREKPVFLFSELFPAGAIGESARRRIETVIPVLRGFGIEVEKSGTDYLIKRSDPILFVLSDKERSKVNAYLARPEIPDKIQMLIGAYIRKKTGKEWQDPLTLERIRSAVMAQKGEYWHEGAKKRVRYEKGYRTFAYLAYQFPVYYVQFEHILLMLAGMGLLPEHMTVLDAGSGPGAATMALTDFLGRSGHGTAEISALELSGEQREAYTFLSSGFSEGNKSVVVYPAVESDIRNPDAGRIPGNIDLLVFQNVLNELSGLTIPERAGIVGRFAELLSPTGIVLIVEPADLSNSVGLRELAAVISRKTGITVISPCLPGSTKQCRPERCWSFVEKSPVLPTRLMEAVADHQEYYRFLNTDIKFSFAVLKKGSSQVAADIRARDRKTALLSSLSRHVGKKINVSGAVMSGDLGNMRTHLWKICDGSPQKPVYIVLPSYNSSAGNKVLGSVPYGGAIVLSGVLVRYNSRHDSYNLLVTRDTRVAIPGKGTNSNK
ncbi:MAG TPA: class I SAM-dependent methyltransferase [Methanoregulaceae archaeon]|nr:class I SAM-dependent methyltransferase [Methanoregulaceae archaeon]